MKISRKRLSAEAEQTGFRPETLEKVIQLLNLLDGLNRHPFLKVLAPIPGAVSQRVCRCETPRSTAGERLATC